MTMGYQPRIDTGSIRALDMHTHVEADHHGHFSLD
ncbi:MAG: 4-hydroxyphenyl-beta-ketoacyl-CoA hydrolase, partial [Actinomycetota bacterium]|nr:4-hydroxyphenyl-beta-ketoacyl-CoA hydrolase [Actinomycetota bacterium]